MDFTWTEEQLEYKEQVAEFGKTLNRDLVRRDQEGVFCRENWMRCAEFGLLGLSVSEEYGGAERDILSSVLALQGLGYGCRDNGLTFAINAQLWTVQLPIARHGTEEQKQRFLPSLCAGEKIGAHVITEPEAGSDVFSLQTHAEPCEGGYRLTGRKRLITFGPIADLALVFATVNPKKGKWGVTAFLVETDRPGFRRGEVQAKMGLRTVPIGEVEMEDCFVPVENRLGAEGAGFAISSSSLEYERCCILASHLGAMEHQLETAVAYARERKQFGSSIGKFQSVSHRLVEMKLRLETSRLLLYKVAWLKKCGKSAVLESALLKLHLGESFMASGLDAIRVHGGVGYLTENEIERDLRDSIGGVIYAGTSDIQRNIVAGMMGL